MFITFSLMILWGFQLKNKQFGYCKVPFEQQLLKMLLLASSGTISESHLKGFKCLLNVQVLASYATQKLIFSNSQLP